MGWQRFVEWGKKLSSLSRGSAPSLAFAIFFIGFPLIVSIQEWSLLWLGVALLSASLVTAFSWRAKLRDLLVSLKQQEKPPLDNNRWLMALLQYALLQKVETHWSYAENGRRIHLVFLLPEEAYSLMSLEELESLKSNIYPKSSSPTQDGHLLL